MCVRSCMRACVYTCLVGLCWCQYLAVKWCNIKCVFLCFFLSSVAVQPSAANARDTISGE